MKDIYFVQYNFLKAYDKYHIKGLSSSLKSKDQTSMDKKITMLQGTPKTFKSLYFEVEGS